MADNRPIGIYDSGLGGLTVWREIRRALPGESLAYLGDGANCPYGSRPREEVQALADAAVARLVELDCKMVVVACNTATAARYGSGIEVLTYPGTGFVELVEGDREDTPEAEAAVRAAVEPMLARGADQIVLGCTHYPFLTPVMERIVDGRAAIVDPSPAVARRVGQLLDRYGLRASADNRPALTFRTFADELYRLRLERKVAAYL